MPAEPALDSLPAAVEVRREIDLAYPPAAVRADKPRPRAPEVAEGLGQPDSLRELEPVSAVIYNQVAALCVVLAL
jgi:hypothetical protein